MRGKKVKELKKVAKKLYNYSMAKRGITFKSAFRAIKDEYTGGKNNGEI